MTETEARYGYPMKQLNIRLSEHLHRRFKAKCAMDGLSLVDAVDELVRAYLSGEVAIGPGTEPPESSEGAGGVDETERSRSD